MEQGLSSIQLRILNEIHDLHSINIHPTKQDIAKRLSNFHTETTTNDEITSLIGLQVIEVKDNKLYLKKEYHNFNWLNHLITTEQKIIVLGMPGNHTIQFISSLDSKNVVYIDHDVAWKSLMKMATNHLSIISPFADREGFNIFGPTLINSLKRGVKVDIITRDINPFSASSSRRKIFSEFIKKLNDEITHPQLTISQFHDGLPDEEISPHIGSVHAKLLIQDISGAYIGSGEFRGNSISKNVEIGYLFFGKEFVINFQKIFDSTKGISTNVDWRQLV